MYDFVVVIVVMTWLFFQNDATVKRGQLATVTSFTASSPNRGVYISFIDFGTERSVNVVFQIILEFLEMTFSG